MIRRGFTLVELIIAMALTSLLGLMTYALFGISANNLVEIDSLETTASKGRFAIEKIRSMFQVAGSFSSPDSVNDPFVQPANGGIRVAGFQSYAGWQNAPFLPYTDISFDGIVLTGAFDFPTSFEAGGIIGNGEPMVIPGNFLGMEKLNRVDPFSDIQPRDASNTYFPNLETQDWAVFTSYSFLEKDLASRLIRITDGLGYVQFLQPDVPEDLTFDAGDVVNMNDTGGSSPRVLNGLSIPLVQTPPFRPVFKGDNNGFIGDLNLREIGLDRTGLGEGDRTYDASLIDTYWLHVIPGSDQDPTNNLLVLERLCAASFASDTGLRNPIKSMDCGSRSRKLIADRVVDFQVWFDCAAAVVRPGGTVNEIASNTNWTQDWLTPIGTETGNTCMAPGANYNPGQARVAHARLTLRTDEERPSFSNVPFVNGDTLCMNSVSCPGSTLRSFDINRGLVGAAPVITFQTDIAIRNSIIKDL